LEFPNLYTDNYDYYSIIIFVHISFFRLPMSESKPKPRINQGVIFSLNNNVVDLDKDGDIVLDNCEYVYERKGKETVVWIRIIATDGYIMIKLSFRKNGKDFDLLIKKIVTKRDQIFNTTRNAFYGSDEIKTEELDHKLLKIDEEYQKTVTDGKKSYDIKISVLTKSVKVADGSGEEPELNILLKNIHIK
jgi:hypothetical protein